MHSLIYLVGLIVVILAVLSLFGLTRPLEDFHAARHEPRKSKLGYWL